MFINLTEHKIIIYGKCKTTTIEPSGIIARCKIEEHDLESIDEVEIIELVKERIKNLPKPKNGVYYIVSQLVMEEATDRFDLLSPDTRPKSVIKNKYGKVIGTRRLRGKSKKN